ncbi:hypothetical protein [Scytonema sp. NUACC26]|uniref:hypothetical protein n=1 Tax=Scytonema sp. NUACC26 TaxID=3140176 RepID=UPI0034DCA2FD
MNFGSDGKKDKKPQELAAAAAANLVHYVLSQKTVLNGIKKQIAYADFRRDKFDF